MREGVGGAAEVQPIELFFDLVYVLAITQLTHRLLQHLTARGAVETLVLLLAVWAAWNYTTWTTNYFEPSTVAVRLMLLGLMFASLVMSSSIPRAFEDWGLAFAGAYVAATIGRTLFALAGFGRGHPLHRVFSRPLVWWSGFGLVWIAGGIAEGDARLILWTIAVVGETTGLVLGYPVPGLGRTRPAEYTIAGEHMAHRCLLFIILALGESILITGAIFGALPSSGERIASFAGAFVATLSLWWIYFDYGAEAGIEIIGTASEPGRLGLTAYTYAHVPMVAGIIAIAAADELTIAHPGDEVSTATAAVMLGGPALFLIGHTWFKWTLWDYVPISRLVALAALAALLAVAAIASAIVLLSAVTAILVALALRDTLAARRAV
jgi:low temperature requirement protein LtrA